jgi:hypothetical protein
MSIHRSYFSKNNTLIYSSYVNTARNPVMQLNFGATENQISQQGFTRFIFDLDLTDLQTKISSGIISTACTLMSHSLRMTNTSSFDTELINSTTSEGRRRATSFDLILFRIPKTSGSTGNPQSWDEGVGYDYFDFQSTQNSSQGSLTSLFSPLDKSFSSRPSNWFQKTTVSGWSTNGIYLNTNSGPSTSIKYSALTIVDTQHFELGNEDIEFNMTNEINSILTGGTTGVTGWGVAYVPEIENLTGLTETYSVGFFTKYTQTFYQPFLETSFDDLVQDNRNSFYSNSTNKLYLYSYIDGTLTNLDSNPLVNIYNNSDSLIKSNLQTCRISTGVYEVTITGITSTIPCTYSDIWVNLTYNGNSLPNIENTFNILPFKYGFNISPESQDPNLYGFDFYGIKQDEKILNTDVRRVGVIIKKAYSTSESLNNIKAYYRIYVREGQTEVQVQDWTEVNRSSNQYYFVFDTRDKIPNEYYVDMKVLTSGEINTYKRTLTFQIVNKK